MTDVFSEVSAELRKDRLQSLWNRFGVYVIASLVAIVLGVAAQVGYTSWRQSNNEAAAVRYAALLADPTPAALAAFVAAEDNGYGALAAFRLAYSQSQAGNTADALASFETLADNRDLPQALRDYAQLQAAIILVDTATNPTDIEARLANILNDEANGFRNFARDITALAYAKANDNAKARTLYQQQLTDPRLSRFSRERAEIMLQRLADK